MHTLTSLLYIVQQKAPIYMLSRSKAPKTQQVEHCQQPKKNEGFSSRHQLVRHISTHKIFAYSGFFSKVAVSVKSIFLNWELSAIVE